MNIDDFKLERYFGKHEFTAKHLLSSSDCDGFEMQYVLNTASKWELDLWQGMKLGYTESEGNSILRESILQYYEMEGIEKVVVATPGELNFISMNVLLESTDHAITISPSYQSLYEVMRSLGCELSFWKPTEDDWTFDVSDLLNLIRENTKLIILNFPHNPTGSYLTLEQLNEIIEIARKDDIYIFSDEMYRKLIVGNVQELPAVCDLYEKGISLWGTSKSFGLAGLRTGWLVSRDVAFLKKVIAFKDYLSICNSAPSEILSVIALNHMDNFLLPNIEKIKENIVLFQKFAVEHDIISSFVPPIAGSVAFVKLNIEGSSQDFSDRLLQETGIMTVPTEMFEYPGKYIRVGFGRRDMPLVLDKLDQYL